MLPNGGPSLVLVLASHFEVLMLKLFRRVSWSAANDLHPRSRKVGFAHVVWIDPICDVRRFPFSFSFIAIPRDFSL